MRAFELHKARQIMGAKEMARRHAECQQSPADLLGEAVPFLQYAVLTAEWAPREQGACEKLITRIGRKLEQPDDQEKV